jgi:predicted nucleotidyltransferase
MSDTFAQLLNPLEPAKAAVLRAVAQVSKDLSTPFMLFGAFARDVHFFHAHGIEISRGTTDVDISVQVPDWDSYGRFSKALQERGFEPYSKEHPEKLVRRGDGQELDLLPFGEIAEGDNIVWPGDNSPWSVIGFDEAFAGALRLVLDGDVIIPVASIPSLVVLKLAALHDRPRVRAKRDGTDVSFVVANYLAAGNKARLVVGPDADILGQCRSDLDLASAMLIGRDIGRVLGERAREHVIELLKHETESTSRCHLVRGMIGTPYGNFARAREVVEWMLRGLAR